MRLSFKTVFVALTVVFNSIDAKKMWVPKQGDTWNYVLENDNFNL